MSEHKILVLSDWPLHEVDDKLEKVVSYDEVGVIFEFILPNILEVFSFLSSNTTMLQF